MDEIYISSTNYDINDTTRQIANKGDLDRDMVDDTYENRTDAALACIHSLYKQLGELSNKVYFLEQKVASQQTLKM
jgi:hypothetical protein